MIRGSSECDVRRIAMAIGRNAGHTSLPRGLGKQRAHTTATRSKIAAIGELERGVIPRHLRNIRLSRNDQIVGDTAAATRTPIRARACLWVLRRSVAHEFAAARRGDVNTAPRVIHGQALGGDGGAATLAVSCAAIAGWCDHRLSLAVCLLQIALDLVLISSGETRLTKAVALANNRNRDAIDRILDGILQRSKNVTRINQDDRRSGGYAARILKIQVGLRQIAGC